MNLSTLTVSDTVACTSFALSGAVSEPLSLDERLAYWAAHFPIHMPEWHDWRWQFKHRVKTYEQIQQLLVLTESEHEAFQAMGINLPFAITPYYLTLMDPTNPEDPLRKTMIPQSSELFHGPEEYEDPCGEDGAMVAPGLVHRYPDRVLFLVNETCAVYCRYCTRSRLVGSGAHEVDFEQAYAYLEAHPEIRDVLISGGDPLIMSDEKLDRILTRLRQIPHLEVVRIGSKIPMVMPQRITDELCTMLKKHHPFFMSVHVAHPDELTPEATAALNKLADAGIPTFSQTVLMAGVNDSLAVMKPLMTGLLKRRVRPYYLYQCDPVQGTRHFRTPVQKGLEIIEGLRGHITGYAVPTYVIDAPGGGGKTPISPHYVIGQDDETQELILKNFKGTIHRYPLVNLEARSKNSSKV
ncbi:MAG: KamA family radical SAM protein [Vampirovibrionales bacterium]